METVVKIISIVRYVLQSAIAICGVYTAVTLALDYFYGFGLPNEPPLIIFWFIGFPFGMLIVGILILVPILIVGSLILWILGIE